MRCKEPDLVARSWPEEEQPHTKILRSPDTCSDAEVLAVLLRTSGNREMSSVELARDILHTTGSITGAIQKAHELQSEHAARIAAAYELMSRALKEKISSGNAMNSPSAVRDYLRTKLQALPHEVFYVLFMDAQNRVIAGEEMFRGTLTQTSVYPREVVKRALHFNAGAVIFSHNHPSGICEPSRADETITQALKQALALIDVRVLDHFIIAGSGVLSFAERGLL